MISGFKSTFITCMTCALVVIQTKTNFYMKPFHTKQKTYFIFLVINKFLALLLGTE